MEDDWPGRWVSLFAGHTESPRLALLPIHRDSSLLCMTISTIRHFLMSILFPLHAKPTWHFSPILGKIPKEYVLVFVPCKNDLSIIPPPQVSLVLIHSCHSQNQILHHQFRPFRVYTYPPGTLDIDIVQMAWDHNIRSPLHTMKTMTNHRIKEDWRITSRFVIIRRTPGTTERQSILV